MSHKANKNDSEPKEKAKYVRWTPRMDDILTEVLRDEYHKGHKGDNGWKPTALQAAVNVINSQLGMSLNKENIRSRLKTWRGLYTAVQELLNQTGFGWNDTKKMVEAEDSVWDDYLQNHSDAAQFRHRSIDNFDDISLIIGNDQANGQGAQTGIEADNIVETIDLEANTDNIGIEGIRFEFEGLSGNESQPATTQPLKSKLPSSQGNQLPKNKRKGRDDAISTDLRFLGENIKIVADAINNRDKIDMDLLMLEIEKISNFDDDLVVEAMEYLSGDKKRADLFLALKENQKRIWLLKRLRREQQIDLNFY
ncbi:hypothetical protein L1049_024613 [Liquidambar formosana]|uniref:Myb/SANT-like domain-containing protein n=1 Tax=Liquidambar formosana TaxID=63359 RepID=A0AAP0RV67_LIQFO